MVRLMSLCHSPSPPGIQHGRSIQIPLRAYAIDCFHSVFCFPDWLRFCVAIGPRRLLVFCLGRSDSSPGRGRLDGMFRFPVLCLFSLCIARMLGIGRSVVSRSCSFACTGARPRLGLLLNLFLANRIKVIAALFETAAFRACLVSSEADP